MSLRLLSLLTAGQSLTLLGGLFLTSATSTTSNSAVDATLGSAGSSEPLTPRSAGCDGILPWSVIKGRISAGQKLEFQDPLHPLGTRTYALYVPEMYSSHTPSSLILDFHGFYDDARSEAREDGVTLAADKEGFIVAYPNGLADNTRDPGDWWNQWNGGGTNGTGGGRYGKHTCTADHSRYPCYRSCARAGICTAGRNRADCGCSGCADDTGFVAALLRKLKDDFCIDSSRIHGTGISNGAIFLYHLATTDEVGSQLASIAPVEGNFVLGFLDMPKVPMPVLDIHGTKDNCVPANVSNSWGKYKWQGCPLEAAGFDGCAVGDDGWFYHPLPEVFTRWASANDCSSSATSQPIRTKHDGNTGWSCVLPFGRTCSATIQFCTHDLGHTWPFHEGKHRVRTREFGEVLWDFMKDKRREEFTNKEDADTLSVLV